MDASTSRMTFLLRVEDERNDGEAFSDAVLIVARQWFESGLSDAEVAAGLRFTLNHYDVKQLGL